MSAVEPSVVASRFAPCSAPPKMGVARPCVEGRCEDDDGGGCLVFPLLVNLRRLVS